MSEKLVRDRIPDKISARGELARFRVADDSEMLGLLIRKLHEEADEILAAATREEKVTELGDVVEVVVALFGQFNLDFHRDVYKPGWKKAEELGGFKKKLVLIQDESKRREE